MSGWGVALILLLMGGQTWVLWRDLSRAQQTLDRVLLLQVELSARLTTMAAVHTMRHAAVVERITAPIHHVHVPSRGPAR